MSKREELIKRIEVALTKWRDKTDDAPSCGDLACLVVDAAQALAEEQRSAVEAFVVSKIATAVKKRVTKRKAKKAAKAGEAPKA